MKSEAKRMSTKDKVVAILLDGMAIKPGISYQYSSDTLHGFADDGQKNEDENNDLNNPANEAIMLMVRSMTSNYKQVIGHFLARSSLGYEKQSKIVCEAVGLLTDAGYHPVLLIMDQHATNIKMAEHLGVSGDTPYFEIDDAEVVVVYDPPHVFKSFRNNFASKNLLVEGEIASFQYIVDLYHHDAGSIPRVVPKLTKSAIQLNTFSKMKVKLATRTLSSSTAKGMLLYIKHEKMGTEAEPTARLIQTMDAYFDVFNSQYLKDNVKVSNHRRALRSNCTF